MRRDYRYHWMTWEANTGQRGGTLVPKLIRIVTFYEKGIQTIICSCPAPFHHLFLWAPLDLLSRACRHLMWYFSSSFAAGCRCSIDDILSYTNSSLTFVASDVVSKGRPNLTQARIRVLLNGVRRQSSGLLVCWSNRDGITAWIHARYCGSIESCSLGINDMSLWIKCSDICKLRSWNYYQQFS